MHRLSPDHPRRGAVSKGCLVGLLLLGLLMLGGGCVALAGVSKYNGIVTNENTVDSAWSEIRNQYKRRYDLVPQLVSTVEGAAEFERSTLNDVIEARASIGSLQLPDDLPTDQATLDAFVAAQEKMGSALSRLLVTVERYPTLKASQNFLSLQDQLEGTENRIAVARRDYIEAVRIYNNSVETFPGNVVAGFANKGELPQLEVSDDVEQVPNVDFDFGGEGR
jgi:LemA protein